MGEQTQTVDRQTVSLSHLTTMGEKKTQVKTDLNEAKPQAAHQASKENPAVQQKVFANLGVAIAPPKPKTQVQAEAQLAHERMHSFTSEGMPQDYVMGLKDGETTALNTKEYVFYGYFQRIRERLDRAWNLSLRENLFRLYRSGRHLASDIDHTTKVMVTLNSGGEITRIQVLEESGTHDLDEAAVRAFNQAGPFPNPPRGIIDSAGQVQIRWDFVLKT